MAFILLVQFSGILIFGYWTTSIRMHIGYYSKSDITTKRITQIDVWLTKLGNIGKNEQIKDYKSFSIIRDYLIKKFTDNQFVLMENKIFNYIKPQNRKRLISHIFNAYEEKFKIIFSFTEPSFFPDFILCCKMVKFIKGSTVLNQNEKSDNFYLITEGKIEMILRYKKLNLNVTELPQYSFFAEDLVLNNFVAKFSYKYYK